MITTDACGFEYENITVIPEKDFAKAAKKAAKSGFILKESGKKPFADNRFFKVLMLIKKRREFASFPVFAIKLGAKFLLKLRH